jgi:integrase
VDADHRYRGGTYVFKVCGDRKVNEKQITSRLAQINQELHAISSDLGIRPKMTTHTARHTWTEWALVNKVPYPLMMQMLGIKSMKSFLHYISRFNAVAVSDVYKTMREQFR